jgi:hypothetical protein
MAQNILSELFANAPDPVRLDETVTYRDVLHAIDPRDLPHRDYAPLIPFVRFVGVRFNTIKFFCPNKYNGWNTYIRFDEWDTVKNDLSISANDAAKLLIWSSPIRMHCPCPSFKFFGYQYILTGLDAAIVPETRFPSIKNPNLKGVCCKHLRRTTKVLPFHLGNIANAIRVQRQSIQAG